MASRNPQKQINPLTWPDISIKIYVTRMSADMTKGTKYFGLARCPEMQVWRVICPQKQKKDYA